jgi:hypothetical protein
MPPPEWSAAWNDIAPSRGQVPDLVGADLGGFLCAVGLDASGFGGYRDRVRNGSHLKRDLSQRDAFIGGDDDPGPLERLEAVMLDFDRVGVRLQSYNAEVADLIRDSFARIFGFLADQRDLGSRHSASGRVDYRSPDGSGDGHLAEALAGEQQAIDPFVMLAD